MQIPNTNFEVRTYSKYELGKLYFPHQTEEIARKYLVRWINGSKVLLQNLRRSGYNKNCKILTPKQVHIIVDHLGIP